MPYYVMVGEGVHPVAVIRATRDRKNLPKRRWMDGSALDFPVPEPIVCELDLNYPGIPKALYDAEPIPLMTAQLSDVLASAGVDNLQQYDAILVDPDSGREYAGYKAFNVVGKVATADMNASKRMGVSDRTMISADFDSLVFDESRAPELRMFRLAEKISAIVVDEKVRAAVEASGIPGIFFYASGEWSG